MHMKCVVCSSISSLIYITAYGILVVIDYCNQTSLVFRYVGEWQSMFSIICNAICSKMRQQVIRKT